MNDNRRGEATGPEEILDGLWAWRARHPEWHPGEWGAEVVSWALRAGDDALLVDPLIPEDGEAVWALVEQLATDARRLAVLVTIPYHVRSAEPIRERLAGPTPFSIHGHAACRDRLSSAGGFEELVPGRELPGGAVSYEIGNPKRFETPIGLPSHDALAFGDSIVGTPDGLRMWSAREVDDGRRRFFAERFAPTFEPLVALRSANVLVGHGPSAIGDGAAQLERAVSAPPWYHPG